MMELGVVACREDPEFEASLEYDSESVILE